MVEVIRFGTDGWRDIIADGFTVENVRRVAQAHAQFLLASGGSSVVVGFDTRFASPRFARAAAEVMAANGLKTFLPGISRRRYRPVRAWSSGSRPRLPLENP